MKLNKKGFTLAEILITLAIIGVIAAILFPSILANYNERTLNAKRQALIGRMSQAMGELADQFRNYADVVSKDPVAGSPTVPDCSNNLSDCVDKGSAVRFINEGLSKVYKIAAVCDNESFAACDIPDEIKRADGSTYSLYDNAKDFETYCPEAQQLNENGHYFKLYSGAFITKNGESILLFYNPNCQGKPSYIDDYIFGDQMMCVNMIYDLNGGKNKPNKIGEDIGFMSVFYSDAPFLATARPYDWKAVKDYEPTTDSSGNEIPLSWDTKTFAEAKAACAALGDNVGLPSLEEGMTMLINRELWAPKEEQLALGDPNSSGLWQWTSAVPKLGYAWAAFFSSNTRNSSLHVYIHSYNQSSKYGARCVYKD